MKSKPPVVNCRALLATTPGFSISSDHSTCSHVHSSLYQLSLDKQESRRRRSRKERRRERKRKEERRRREGKKKQEEEVEEEKKGEKEIPGYLKMPHDSYEDGRIDEPRNVGSF